MAINSKNKGNSFERDISKKLSERFKDLTKIDQSFRRNADSGSFFGGSNQKRKITHDLEKATFGDIICPNNFKFSIECKAYASSPSLKLIIKQDVKLWDTWIKQAQQDCKNSNLQMMIIIKYNGQGLITMLDFVPVGLNPIIRYKDFYIFDFDSILNLEDTFFFDK